MLLILSILGRDGKLRAAHANTEAASARVGWLGAGGLTARARVGSYVRLAVVALVRPAVQCTRHMLPGGAGERKLTASASTQPIQPKVLKNDERAMRKRGVIRRKRQGQTSKRRRRATCSAHGEELAPRTAFLASGNCLRRRVALRSPELFSFSSPFFCRFHEADDDEERETRGTASEWSDKWGRVCPGRVRTCRGREVSVHVTRWGRGGVPVPSHVKPHPPLSPPPLE
ncbi:hypothetical protein BHE74_00036004 [Ensete ventricosum]|uniref:Uncharacterized protein n=1 Tax=Ensete ventricosum TaxID=4639 RepID=A0A445MGX6_ENSVE|nr:hypothetical protein BHE74_00036004 [Ensete ventricosum]RZR73522.1 hypothetical protein BHM03_00025234 [Ensete ventricosum]